MAAEYNIAEFKVFNAKKNKEKALRVLVIDEVPKIQLRSLRKDHVHEIDISSTPKIFLPILADNNRNEFQMILKDAKSSQHFYCDDKDVFDRCIRSINGALRKYHGNRDSMDSVYESPRISTVKPRSRGGSQDGNTYVEAKVRSRGGSQDIIPPLNVRVGSRTGSDNLADEMEIYMTMNQNDNNYENDSGPLGDGITIRLDPTLTRVRSSAAVYINAALNVDNQVPNFNKNEEPYKEVCKELTKLENKEIPMDLPVNVINTLLLRKEILSPGGLEILCKHVSSEIDVKENENALWINHISTTSILFNKILHIGDRIYSVNGFPVQKKVEFIQRCKEENVLLRIQRLPKAKVFAMTSNDLRASIKGFTFTNTNYGLSNNSKDSYVVTEVDSKYITDSDAIGSLLGMEVLYHTVVLHPSSFLKALSINRKYSVSRS